MITIAIVWIVWCSFHSLLISHTFMAWMRRRFGEKIAYHRIVYVCFSFASLIPVLMYQAALPQTVIFSWQGPWRLLQALLLLYSGFLFIAGARMYDMKFFLGISQIKEYRSNHAPAAKPFKAEGILQYIRHPWYAGGIAILWVFGDFTDITIMAKTILTAYLVIGTLLEERKLLKELGIPYRDYCNKVPMLFPFKFS